MNPRFLVLIIVGFIASACYLIRPSVPACEQLKWWSDDMDGAQVSASCESPNVVRIAVEHHKQNESLRGFSVDFCGTPVRSTQQPDGWTVNVSKPTSNTLLDWLTKPPPRTTIDWRLEGEDRHIASGTLVEGFVVQLDPDWQPGLSLSVQWESSGVSFLDTSHDC